MKTLLILWMSMSNGIATDSVQSKDFESLDACETYAAAVMQDSKAVSYQCIEGYSMNLKKVSSDVGGDFGGRVKSSLTM